MKLIPAIATFAIAISFVPFIHADEMDRLTKITFSGPVEVPGKILPAGKYVFKLLDDPAERNVVQIYNEDQNELEVQFLAISDRKMHLSGKTVIQFAERPADQPEAIKAWFYPGMQDGLAFVYPHDRAVRIAKESGEPVYSTKSDYSGYSKKHLKSGDSDSTSMKHSDVTTVQPDGTESGAESTGRP